ncbi:MAG: hypothetical protein KDD10_02865 [Phaeodactylibacter sp.]|nr:hypothetical protein [Phaeodactylibacter sp.]MCB9294311.1 hypothetical protein [Lewinellaceae bacterium]
MKNKQVFRFTLVKTKARFRFPLVVSGFNCRSLHSFIDHYQPREAWVVNRSLQEKAQVGATTVWFRPWYELLPL